MSIITNVHITTLSFPLKKPFSNHIRKITHIKGMVLQIYASGGIIGQGFIYGLSDMPYKEIIDIITNKFISRLSIDCDSFEDIKQLMSYWEKEWASLKTKSNTQSELTALSIIDIAIWDVFLQSLNTSLYQYLGSAQEKIAVYGTTGWLSLSSDELIAECKEYKSNGVMAFKARIGHEEDYSRIKQLREAMGSEFMLMLDANQRYSVEEAAKISIDFLPFKLIWLEEPTKNNLDEIRRIKQSSSLPLALGENIIEEKDFEIICQEGLTDILQPDLPRCGGITGFIKVVELALKYNIPVCNHLLYELSLNIVAAYKNGHMIEYDNLLPIDVFTHSFKVVDGYIMPSKTIGTGVELTDQAMKKYAIDFYELYSEPRVFCRP